MYNQYICNIDGCGHGEDGIIEMNKHKLLVHGFKAGFE